ncbi:MAG: PP2C family protein-serine/threonine phosphatase, partial [Acidobacteriota bacterium]
LSIRLEPRDMLILYTDGLTEAENPAGEQYGEERLLNLLGTHNASSPQSLLDAAAADVTAFSNGARKTDDLTMLVLERR